MPTSSSRRRALFARPRLDWLEDRTNPSVFNPVPNDTLTLSGGGSQPTSIALGDLDGNGFLDVVVANFGTQTIDIYLGALTGAPDQSINAAGLGPSSVAIADVDGDGVLDIIAGNVTTGDLSVYLGLGGGAIDPNEFVASDPIAGAAFSADSIALGDFNNDGFIDLAIADDGNNAVHVFLNSSPAIGSPSFVLVASLAVGGNPLAVSAADFNGDGNLDLAVATENIGINVFIGNGSGGFGAVPTIALAGTTFLDVADFNGDGRIDIIAARVGATQTVLINTTAPGTNGAFFQASNIDALIVDFGTVKAVDINFDDRPDLIFSSNDNFVQVVFNTTLVGTFSASFASTTSFDATPQLLLTPGVGPFALAVGDLNNDGFKDLLVGNVTSGTVAVYFNEPSFELLPMLNVAAVVGQDFGGPFVTIFYRDARAPLTFTAFPFVSPFGVYTGGVRVAIGDVTGDGVMDIITGAGPGGGPRIQVFDGFDLSERASFFALSYDARLGGILNLGVYIAFGVIGGEPAIIVGAGEGAGFGPRVQVVRAFGVLDRGFDPNFSIPETPETVFASFFAYQQFAGGIQFTSGVRVAAGDVDGDGDWDVITGPGPDGGPLLKIFTNVNGLFGEPFPTQQSFVFPPETTALGLGLYVSFASFNGVPTVVAGVGGRPGQPGFGANISAFSTVNLPEVPTVANLSASFFLDYPPSQLTTGVRVGTGDFNGDGVPDLLAGAGSPFPDLFPIDGLLVRAVGIKPLTDGPGSVLVNSTITRDNDLALLGGTALDTELLGIFVG